MMKGKPVVALVFLLSLAALADPRPYSPDRGPLRVLTIDELVLHDAARDKDLRLKIYYPEGPGPFPVIIFSHGAFASRETYSALGEYWASYGYVSIHPSHADSMHDSGYRGTLRQVLRDSELWRSRPQDISFVIDSLPQIEKLAPTLKGKLAIDIHYYGEVPTREHRAIMKAILEHDPEAARRHMYDHIIQSRGKVLRLTGSSGVP